VAKFLGPQFAGPFSLLGAPLFVSFFWERFSYPAPCSPTASTDPPAPPLISGYMEGQIIPAGSVQKLLCVSSGGNPLATLTWYKNDKRVSAQISFFSRPLFAFSAENSNTHSNTHTLA